MWSIASSSLAMATMAADVGILVSISIGTVMTGLVALLGLGFAVQKTKEHVTGNSWGESWPRVNWRYLKYMEKNGDPFH